MELMHLFHKNSIFILIFCNSSSATHKSYAQEHNGSGVFISTSPSLDPTLRKPRRAPHHSSSMLSKRRVTVQPVHQAGFSGEHGRNILSVARALSTSGGGVENIIRSHSYHGALQVEASLPPATQLMECSSCDDDAGLLACRVSTSTEEQLLFYAGRNLVASTTLSPECCRCTPPPAEMAPRLPMQCFRVASEMNVAVFACGHNTLCVCSPETSKEQLMHFTDHNIACMGPGRDGRGELTAMLDAHVVVVCGLMSRPLQSSLHLHESLRSSTLEGSCLSSATAERLTDFQVLVAGKLPSLPVASDAVPRQLVWGGHHLLWVLFSDGCVCALRLPEPASSSTTTSTEDDAHNSTSSVEQPTAMELVYHGNITPGEMMFVTADPCGLQLHYCSSHPSNTDLIHYGSIQLIQGASATTPARCTHYSTTCTDRIYGLRYDYGKYHLLTQSAKGQRPLYVTTLPRRSQPSDQTAACQNIMWGPADQLGQHCDALLAHAQKLSAAVHTFSSEEEVMGGLEELLEMQHSAYALLCRQHISMDRSGLPPSESTPNHMLNLISTKYTQLSVLLLFARLGALPLMRVPLNAALHANTAREASLATQAQLRQLMKQSYPAVGSSVDGVLEAQVWPDQATLCADRLTAAMGCSLGSQGDHLTLLQVVMRVEAITPDLSLLLMYCSYAMASTTVPQSVAEQLRQNFLEQFYQPSSTRVWASICFFADHGRVAAEDDDDDNHDKRDATFFGSHSMPVRAVVAAVRQLGNIPRMDLLPPLVHGLLRASAVDAIFFLVGPLLAQNEGSTLAPSLVMCILLVALLSCAPEVVVAIHDACRGTAMERMTTEALACAAIHGGSIAPLRGLVSVGSWQDEVVHEVLAQHPLAAARDRVRLPFLILTQRLEEAYHLAESMAVGGADATQQAHAVATHLRNLLSKATSESVDLHQPSTTSPAAAAQHATPAAAAAITPLDRREDEDEEERLRLMRGSGQLSTSSVVVRRGGAAANVSSVSGGLPMCGGVASAAVLRPSSLLASLDRGIQSMQHNTTLELSQAHHQPRASATTVSVAWPKRGEVVSVERSGAGEATSSMQLQHTTTTTNFGENVVEQPARSRVVGGAPTMPRSFVGGEQRCEAVLKRSGTACGRLRPCPYHDRQS